MMNVGEFVRLFGGLALAIEEGFPEVMDACGEVVQKEAMHMVGGGESGNEYPDNIAPFRDWEKLHDETIADKIREGVSPPDKPLERSGLMKNNIERSAGPFEAHVGSNFDEAVWHEFGTVNMAPRSFLGGALVRKADEMPVLIWSAVEVYLSTSGTFAYPQLKLPGLIRKVGRN